jgi:hypothetical protein
VTEFLAPMPTLKTVQGVLVEKGSMELLDQLQICSLATTVMIKLKIKLLINLMLEKFENGNYLSCASLIFLI